MTSGQVCVLVSGGVDSAVLVGHLLREGSEVQPVYVRTGMLWETAEERWLARFLDALSGPALKPLRSLAFPLTDVYASHWSVSGTGAPTYHAPDEAVYLPGRNVILMAKTAVYCALVGIQRIAIGVLGGNPFPDATDAFFDDLGGVLSKGLEHPIRIERPFARLRKSEVVRLGAQLPLELTFSCINPVDDLHCGNCNKCAERQRGFLDADVLDRTQYAKQQEIA